MSTEEKKTKNNQNSFSVEAVCNSNMDLLGIGEHEHNPDFSKGAFDDNGAELNYENDHFATNNNFETEEVLLNISGDDDAKNDFICQVCDLIVPSLEDLKRHGESCEKGMTQITEPQIRIQEEMDSNLNLCVEDEDFILPNVVVLVDEEKTIKIEPMEDAPEKFPCTLCDRIFSSSSGLKRHTRACEKAKSSIKMKKRSINIQKEILESYITASEGDEYILPDAFDERQNSTTMKEIAVSTVAKKIINRIETSYIPSGKCDCCGQSLDTAHTEGKFECIDCKFFFTTKTALARHRTIIHNEEKIFKCVECGAICPDKHSLKHHMRSHEPDANDKTVSCPVCHKKFKRKYHLVRHNLQTGCDGSERPTFPCQICSRVFTRKDNLSEHLRAHTGETKRKQKYNCEICSQEFTGIIALNQHKKLHLGDKPHACDLCEKKFSLASALKKHRRTHTGERPYECVQCLARFAAKETLNRHVRTHTGDKPYSCEFCGKSFIQATQLRTHLLHHTGQNGFTCETCGKAFDRRNRLTAHIRVNHENQTKC